jgi:uncharacterized membrane protein
MLITNNKKVAEMDEDTQPVGLKRPLVSRRTAILVSVVAAVVLALWTFGTPPGPMGKAVAVGYAICHRIAVRSFMIDDIQMPLCARCTGIYLGVIVGLLVAVTRERIKVSRLPPLRVSLILGLFVIAIGVDGLNSYIQLFPATTGIYTPQNWLRLVTGMGGGLVMVHFLLPVFNAVVWLKPDERHSLDNWRDLAVVCAVAAIMIALVLSNYPPILWILGVLSALGVVIVLVMIGTVLFFSVNRLRPALNWRELLVPLLAGLTLAVLEIGAINIVRFALTGTWNGFIVG